MSGTFIIEGGSKRSDASTIKIEDAQAPIESTRKESPSREKRLSVEALESAVEKLYRDLHNAEYDDDQKTIQRIHKAIARKYQQLDKLKKLKLTPINSKIQLAFATHGYAETLRGILEAKVGSDVWGEAGHIRKFDEYCLAQCSNSSDVYYSSESHKLYCAPTGSNAQTLEQWDKQLSQFFHEIVDKFVQEHLHDQQNENIDFKINHGLLKRAKSAKTNAVAADETVDGSRQIFLFVDLCTKMLKSDEGFKQGKVTLVQFLRKIKNFELEPSQKSIIARALKQIKKKIDQDENIDRNKPVVLKEIIGALDYLAPKDSSAKRTRLH